MVVGNLDQYPSIFWSTSLQFAGTWENILPRVKLVMDYVNCTFAMALFRMFVSFSPSPTTKRFSRCSCSECSTSPWCSSLVCFHRTSSLSNCEGFLLSQMILSILCFVLKLSQYALKYFFLLCVILWSFQQLMRTVCSLGLLFSTSIMWPLTHKMSKHLQSQSVCLFLFVPSFSAARLLRCLCYDTSTYWEVSCVHHCSACQLKTGCMKW